MLIMMKRLDRHILISHLKSLSGVRYNDLSSLLEFVHDSHEYQLISRFTKDVYRPRIVV